MKNPMLTTFAASLAALLLSSLTAYGVDSLPTAVAPNDPHLHYQGRWDTRDSAGPRCEWSGCSVTLRFHGTAANAKLKAAGNDIYQIVVDGKPTEVLKPTQGEATAALAADLSDGDHTVELFRRTEASQGRTQILGFQLSPAAKLLAVPKAEHSIEIIGDSISCGYGNEGASQNEHFTPATENEYLAYGAVAARHFSADFSCIAWSGRKMWPNNTVPEIYDLTLPTDPRSKWDYTAAPQPQVILINLATNDFNPTPPDEAKWTAAYEDFIKHLRKVHPQAFIFVASGTMMSDGWPPKLKVLSSLKTYLAKIVSDVQASGDKKIAEIDFTPQDQKNGIGSDWHPSVKTHELMAQSLEAAIEKDLGWKATAP